MKLFKLIKLLIFVIVVGGLFLLFTNKTFVYDTYKSDDVKEGIPISRFMYVKENNLDVTFYTFVSVEKLERVKDEYLKVTQGKLPHDWELNIISAIQNGCYYLDIPLIDYRIHNNNTIGMDNIVDGNIINEKKQRVNERIEQTKAQIENVNFTLGLELNREQKKYCLKYKDYLTQRV